VIFNISEFIILIAIIPLYLVVNRNNNNVKIWVDSFRFFIKTTIKIIENNFNLYNWLFLIIIFLYSKMLNLYNWNLFDKIIMIFIAIYMVKKYKQVTKVIYDYYCKFIDSNEKYMLENIFRIILLFLIMILGIFINLTDINLQIMFEESTILEFVKTIKDYLILGINYF
jgi:hypothetical protein